MTSTSDAPAHVQQVRRYYDQNSATFERRGHGGASIHRAVWGPGVSTRDEAIHYVDDLILAALPTDAGQPTIVDLGCGLGASLLYLAGRADLIGEGLTISQWQASRATELIAEAGLAHRVRCREGNYLAVPDDLAERADVTFSIEAFLHSPDADRYFHQATRTLRPGGTLIVCDDFLTWPEPPSSARGARWLDEFRTGWRVGTLLTVDQACAAAAAHGLELVRDLDLTAALELRRPRDLLVTAAVALGRLVRPSGEYWQSLVGGNALQLALVNKLVGYHFLELRRGA